MTVKDLRAECAEKRDEYHHARQVYAQAMRLGLAGLSDLTALRTELQQTLVAYYAVHSALHSALRPRSQGTRLH